MPATSPSTDAVARLHARLAAEQPLADRLAGALLALIDAPEPDHHQHLLGNPDVCCRMEAQRLAGPQRKRAAEAITAWQQARTGDNRR